MPYAITPVLGTDVRANGPLPYYDSGKTVPSPALGTRVTGNDGHDYVFVKASAAIAAAAAPGTAVQITEPAFTAAAGAGGFNAPIAGVANGDFFWARRTDI